MGMGTSTFVIRWVNLLTMLLVVAVIILGVWMSTHNDGCRRSLTFPVIALGGFIFLMFPNTPRQSRFARTSHVGGQMTLHVSAPGALQPACEIRSGRASNPGGGSHSCDPFTTRPQGPVASIIGFLGACKRSVALLWIYLVVLLIVLIAILVFTVLAFIVTNNGSGHMYKEYKLNDYSSWFLKQLNNTNNWKRLKSCLVKSEQCRKLSKKYKTIKQLKSAELTPIEVGCCRPPSECGYPAVNASYYDLSFHSISSNKDCKLYKNMRTIKCYNCESCKAGVAQYMKTEWRHVAIFNVVLFVVLSMVYFVGCCARRNAASYRSKA